MKTNTNKFMISLFILLCVMLVYNNVSAVTLENTLIEYESIEEYGGWNIVSSGNSIKKGDCGPRVTLLQDRLSINSNSQECFDEVTEEEVKKFQSRHGLVVDGIVGSKTLRALNVPVSERIKQIELNIERQKDFLPDEQYVLVNIPAFELIIVENNNVLESLQAIVGTNKNKTPVLTSKINYIELSPYWNIPQSIASTETLINIKKDPNYLSRNNIVVFEDWTEGAKEINPNNINWSNVTRSNFKYKLRQDPGVLNPLGNMKFMFQNDYNVYLHDTNKRHLFYKQKLEFSHGCVRVEDPIVLALYLLEGNSKWSYEKLNALISKGETTIISLPTPVSIYIVYWTVWIDKDGIVNFRDDIYGLDKLTRK